ncbi:MAG: HAMP domain-containing sensor histidine kinase [Gammaproteobacteria bacterium]|jgi:signal transduction histidine kinase
MAYRQPLRTRIVIASFLFGFLLSLVFGTAVYLGVRRLEQNVVSDTMQAQLDYFVRLHRQAPRDAAVHSGRLRSYVTGDGATDEAPAFLRKVGPGLHDVTHDGHLYHVAVRAEGGRRYVIAFDDTRMAQRKQRLGFILLVGISGASYLAIWMGFWFSRRIIEPVRRLADQVRSLDPTDNSLRLGGEYANDEVGELARAFDEYRATLHDFLEREREFAGNVSHELRTPLSVISGAAEVLSHDANLGEVQRSRVERIRRAATEMAELVSAFLVLARGQEPRPEMEYTVAVNETLRELVGEHREAQAGSAVAIELVEEGALRIPAPARVLAVVVGNLLRNAIEHTHEGRVRLTVTSDSVTISDTGSGMRPEVLARVFERHFRGTPGRPEGAGLGLAIVKRICDRYGWDVAIDSREGEGTEVHLRFNAR